MGSALMVWLVPSGGGALLLAFFAVVAERVFGPRRPEIAAGLWWAGLVRLVLPPNIGSPVGLSLDVDVATASAGAVETIAAVLGWVWLAGVVAAALLAARRVLAERRAWSRRPRRTLRPSTERLIQRSARALGLRRAPRAWAVDGGAACVGVFAPWIAVPRELERSSRRRDLEVVLLHELAHLKRRDGLRHALVLTLQCAFWFHPAAWLAGRRLGALAEIECDRMAAAAARGGVESCRTTLLAEARGWIERDTTLARGFTHPRSVLLARLRALDGPRRGRKRLHVALTFVLALGCIGPAVRSFVIPPYEELEGCLQKRYALYAALAEANAQASQR